MGQAARLTARAPVSAVLVLFAVARTGEGLRHLSLRGGDLGVGHGRQDSIILNLQRACEAAIDLAMHVVRRRRLGVPQETRDAFRLLQEAGALPSELADRLMRMVGFRNVAIHDDRRLDLQIVRRIVTSHLDDFLAFTNTMLKQDG